MKRMFLVILLMLWVIKPSYGRDIFHEFLIKNIEVRPSMIIMVCETDRQWCNGYFTAIIHSLEENGTNPCVPRDENNAQIGDGIWAIVKSWLYRQPQDKEIQFSSVKSAFVENSC